MSVAIPIEIIRKFRTRYGKVTEKFFLSPSLSRLPTPLLSATEVQVSDSDR